MTNEKVCAMSSYCSDAGKSDTCTNVCPAFIGIHGVNGRGGRMAATGIPDIYRNVLLSTSPARSNQTAAYTQLDGYASTFSRQFSEGQRVTSRYLYSAGPGTGKTTSAAALANEYVVRHYIGSHKRGLVPLERPAYFLDVNRWQADYNLAVMMKDESLMSDVRRRMNLATTTPFVVLDDVGIRAGSETFQTMLHVIINHRVSNGLATVYTSNIPQAELKALFSAASADRVRDMCPEITFMGNSKRGLRK